MYVVTFYSFKGGVGRSMALANVAAELTNRGRNVLIVDFDLEAPGLDTFNFGVGKKTNNGIVEFVSYYIRNNESPQVAEYIVHCNKGDDRKGNLWLMPAGKLDNDYASRLSQIDWNDLYKNRYGYILFEDLKAQWKKELSPDYVLIDSRTGHSDVSGICTRQLPDSVVFLFFPNEQNLIGLRKVVCSVDDENENRSGKDNQIEKHFVTSNVPDLDDEDQILADRLVTFSKDLKYSELSATIHRYNSLALLNQVIFTSDRPKTRLAQEYRGLVDQIVLRNLEDRDGAVSFIHRLLERNYLSKESGADDATLTSKIETILSRHNTDYEILYLISIVKERSGDYSDAIQLLEKAQERNKTADIPALRKARLLLYTANYEQSLEEIWNALDRPQLGFADVRLALNLLTRIKYDELVKVIYAPSLLYLEQAEFLSILNSHFHVSKDKLSLCEDAITHYVSANNIDLQDPAFMPLRQVTALVKIGLNKGGEAIKLLSKTRPDMDSEIALLFNYAMAEWSSTRIVPFDLFKLILIKVTETEFSKSDANFKQCISLCFWLDGNIDRALDILSIVENEIRAASKPNFSCWSYLYLERREYLEDISQMKEAFEHGDILPSCLQSFESL